MKKITLLFITLLIFMGFTPIQAEGIVTTEIPVEAVGGGRIQIDGERNLPEETIITNKGSFVINFHDPVPGDVYDYTIHQIPGDDLTVLYDDTVYLCRVYILDLNGTVSATTVISIQGKDVKPDEAVFRNGSIKPVTVNPPVKKTVNGQGAPLSEFKFAMKAVSNTAGYERQMMPMPEESAHGEKKVLIHGGQEFEFGDFDITIPGVYVYSIEEIVGNEAGFTYDTTVYTITYIIEEVDGALQVSDIQIRKGNQTVEEIEFVNEYKTPHTPTPTPTPKPTHTPITTPTPTPRTIIEQARNFVNTGTGRGVFIASFVSVLAGIILIGTIKKKK